MATSKKTLVMLVAFLASMLVLPAGPAAAAEATCSRPESDAQYLELFPLPYSDSHLTIAVRVSPQAPPEYIDAIYDAIEVWQGTLEECFGGAVTLDTTDNWAKADIRLSYVPMLLPNYGGVTLVPLNQGKADQGSIIFMKSDYPPGRSGADNRESLEYFYASVLHEIGHALGLGHAQPILESHDLMGYGEYIEDPDSPDVTISQCDVDALAATWTAFSAGQDASPTFQC